MHDAPRFVDLGIPRTTLKLVPLRHILRMLLKPRERWTQIPTRRNPAGSKVLRRFAKVKTGLRKSYAEAMSHYAQLQEPKLRAGASRFERERHAAQA